MIMIVGGAYQGKRDYALSHYDIRNEDIVLCDENSLPDFTAPCLDRLEEFVFYCVKNGLSAREIMEQNESCWMDSILICREIFSGIVPIDETVRAWREETGRLFTWLSGKATHVTRLFCGIPQELK